MSYEMQAGSRPDLLVNQNCTCGARLLTSKHNTKQPFVRYRTLHVSCIVCYYYSQVLAKLLCNARPIAAEIYRLPDFLEQTFGLIIAGDRQQSSQEMLSRKLLGVYYTIPARRHADTGSWRQLP